VKLLAPREKLLTLAVCHGVEANQADRVEGLVGVMAMRESKGGYIGRVALKGLLHENLLDVWPNEAATGARSYVVLGVDF
jgi:hypothetical protein